jgi:DNA replication protein DnaC
VASVVQELHRVPLLVLDDLGSHASTDWVDEQVFVAIGYRYDRLLPTVVTTNATAWDTLGDQLRSRLMDNETGELVRMPEGDRRVQR